MYNEKNLLAANYLKKNIQYSVNSEIFTETFQFKSFQNRNRKQSISIDSERDTAEEM